MLWVAAIAAFLAVIVGILYGIGLTFVGIFHAVESVVKWLKAPTLSKPQLKITVANVYGVFMICLGLGAPIVALGLLLSIEIYHMVSG